MNLSITEKKLIEREEILRLTEEFLSRGGKIKYIPHGVQAFNPLRNNQWVSKTLVPGGQSAGDILDR